MKDPHRKPTHTTDLKKYDETVLVTYWSQGGGGEKRGWEGGKGEKKS